MSNYLELLGNIIDPSTSQAYLDSGGNGTASYLISDSGKSNSLELKTDLVTNNNFYLIKTVGGASARGRVWTDLDFSSPPQWGTYGGGIYYNSGNTIIGSTSSSDSGLLQVIDGAQSSQRLRASNTFGTSVIYFDTGQNGTNRSDTPTSIFQTSSAGLIVDAEGSFYNSGTGITTRWIAPITFATHGNPRMRIGDYYDSGLVKIWNLGGGGDQFVYTDNSGNLLKMPLQGFDTQNLIDTSLNPSVDWGNRTLYDSSVNPKFDWENMLFSSDISINGSVLTSAPIASGPTPVTAQPLKIGDIGTITGTTAGILSGFGLSNEGNYLVVESNGVTIYLWGSLNEPI